MLFVLCFGLQQDKWFPLEIVWTTHLPLKLPHQSTQPNSLSQISLQYTKVESVDRNLDTRWCYCPFREMSAKFHQQHQIDVREDTGVRHSLECGVQQPLTANRVAHGGRHIRQVRAWRKPQVASAIVGLQMCASAVAWLISAVLVEHVHTLYTVGLALTKQRRARMSGAVCS